MLFPETTAEMMMDSDGNETPGVDGHWDASEPGHAELVQMRIRMIAMENLLLAVLAGSDQETRRRVRERADEIRPRPDAVDHPLTELARAEMLRLLERAERRGDGN